MDLKQEMDRAGERIECVEYRVTERTDEIDEHLQTRVREICKFKCIHWSHLIYIHENIDTGQLIYSAK